LSYYFTKFITQLLPKKSTPQVNANKSKLLFTPNYVTPKFIHYLTNSEKYNFIWKGLINRVYQLEEADELQKCVLFNSVHIPI
jgi:hypothetical protein